MMFVLMLLNQVILDFYVFKLNIYLKKVFMIDEKKEVKLMFDYW